MLYDNNITKKQNTIENDEERKEMCLRFRCGKVRLAKDDEASSRDRPQPRAGCRDSWRHKPSKACLSFPPKSYDSKPADPTTSKRMLQYIESYAAPNIGNAAGNETNWYPHWAHGVAAGNTTDGSNTRGGVHVVLRHL